MSKVPPYSPGPEAGQGLMPPGVGSVCTSLAWVEWHSRLGGILTCHCHPEDFCMSTPSQERPSEEKPWGHLFCSHDLRATQLHAGPGEGPGVTVRKVLCGSMGQWPRSWAILLDGQVFQWVKGYSRPKAVSFPCSLTSRAGRNS